MKADLELVEEVKAGQRNSFSELVRRHQKALVRLCVRFTHDLDMAEEIVQESFIKAYEKIHLFEGRASFKSWLFQIAVNTAKNSLRANRHETVNVDNVHISVNAVAESGMVKRDIAAALSAEVDRLPHRQRMAVVLRIYEDLSFKEIAQIMDCPYDTAKANFRHAVLKIKEAFQENEVLKQWMEDQEEPEIEFSDSYAEVDQ